ncbi:MAG: hypothetical protein AVDCRST_MAG93-1165 [uncultured Chloroflexia bacterium]|uniref:Uncharacterized protein n=1 Tax=uncultured Chloroflexia bacterium TaxID=1672391 RepID=A0A6J4I1L2_9CHLR|nr:MAG: hypothetical protein AVDCRST_MAG93-1165 [uncultured Chloroflexia bacterium]
MGQQPYLDVKAEGNGSMAVKQGTPEDVYGVVLQDPRAMVRAPLPEPQWPAMQAYIPRRQRLWRGHHDMVTKSSLPKPCRGERWLMKPLKGTNEAPTACSDVVQRGKAGWPTGGDPYGHGVAVVVRTGESPVHGEGRQVVSIHQKVRYA